MKHNSLKNISEILQHSTLAKIVQRANELNVLHIHIQQILPREYQRFYRIANIIEGELVFEVQNATIRQGLLMQQKQLLASIQHFYPHIQSLKFRINPNFKPL